MTTSDVIYVAGHTGLVGSALVRQLDREGYGNLLLRTSDQLDLADVAVVQLFFASKRPDYVLLPATRTGGILREVADSADYLKVNFAIQRNVIDAACRAGVQKLLLITSSSIYPKYAPEPLREELLQAGPLAPEHEAYAMAELASIALCRAYAARHGLRCATVIASTVYGPGDDFDIKTGGVLPLLIRRLYEARECATPRLVLPGSGGDRRELLHADDLAAASLLLMRERNDPAPVNVGTGRSHGMRELAGMVGEVIGYPGGLGFEKEEADPLEGKALEVSRIRSLGWEPAVTLPAGIAATYRWYLESRALAVVV